MKCHQAKIRELAALSPEPDEHLKREAAASLANASVREITRKEAESIILKFEYLKNLGQSTYYVGLVFTHPVTGVEYLGGCSCFGSTGGSNVAQSICGKEYASQVAVLVRGATAHWVHPHSATWMTTRACNLMAKHGKNIFIGFADESAGEKGRIYAGSNWLYVGRGGTDTVQHRANGRIVGSKIIASRVKDRTGRPDRKQGATLEDVDRWAAEMRAQGKTVKGSGYYQYVERMSRAEAKQRLVAEHGEFVPGIAKHRYIHFAGDRRIVKKLRKALKLKVLPYPQRHNKEIDDMAVNIEQELRTQLAAVEDKLAALGELTAQRDRIAATLKLLTGEITLEDVTKRSNRKSAVGGGGKTMSEMHKAKIKLSNLKRRLAETPKDADLKRKIGDIEALITSLSK